MSRRELNRAVASATGESVESIERRGFQVVDDPQGPLILDWDADEPGRLPNFFAGDDWPERMAPLPSYDEELDDDSCCPALRP